MLLMGCAQRMVNALTPEAGYTRHAGLAYGELERQRLDVYVPDGVAGAAPVVVFFYGGGWREGERDGYRFMGQALSSQGYVVVIPDYRLYPEVRFPSFIEDGALAVAWTRRNIAGYGGDVENLFLMGHSAGAHMAALLTLDDRYLQAHGGGEGWIRGMIGLAGPYDFLPFRSDFYRVVFEPESQFPDSQPVNFVNGAAPPMLLMQGEKDAVVSVNNTRSLARAVETAGGSVRAILYERQSHLSIIAGLSGPLRAVGPMMGDVKEFIETVRVPAGVNAAAGSVQDDDGRVEHGRETDP
ncbi:alpha/beta hydrolase [Ectothiorhodospiraceae bacterium WFHF3C12]|nr:alpha/beta hydrolase [Ectothiorhodospiraceae bacterium WFHF3C12]